MYSSSCRNLQDGGRVESGVQTHIPVPGGRGNSVRQYFKIFTAVHSIYYTLFLSLPPTQQSWRELWGGMATDLLMVHPGNSLTGCL